ncbi:hypothetical protein D3C76_1645420 [compost metagenome]
MAKRSAQKVFSRGIYTLPPALKPLNSRSASSALSTLRDTETPCGLLYGWPGGQSEAIRLKAPTVRQVCMIRLGSLGIPVSSGASAKDMENSSPPSTSSYKAKACLQLPLKVR